MAADDTSDRTDGHVDGGGSSAARGAKRAPTSAGAAKKTTGSAGAKKTPAGAAGTASAAARSAAAKKAAATRARNARARAEAEKAAATGGSPATAGTRIPSSKPAQPAKSVPKTPAPKTPAPKTPAPRTTAARTPAAKAPEVRNSAAEADVETPVDVRSVVPEKHAAPEKPVAPETPADVEKRTDVEKPADVEKRAVDTTPAREPECTSSGARVAIRVTGLSKSFDGVPAVTDLDLTVLEGSMFGIVGPNGAGKTTTLAMLTGLVRPDAGSVVVDDLDVWTQPDEAKKRLGILPDRLRLFDRLTGGELLYYSGTLRGLDGATVRTRSAELAHALGLTDALPRLVSDYSAGMTKKVALAAALIHAPRVLVLDEPFESVDPVSAETVISLLRAFTAGGGTVVLSGHGIDVLQRVCDSVAIIVEGTVRASGTIDEVRGAGTLEERFIDLAGGRVVAEGLEWLHGFSA